MKAFIKVRIMVGVALLFMAGRVMAENQLVNSILPPDHLLENLPWLGDNGKIESRGLFDFENFRGLGPKDVILVYRQSAPVSELDKPHNQTLAICFYDARSQKYTQALAVENGPIQWVKLMKESNWPSPILIVLRNNLKGQQVLRGYTCVDNQIKRVLDAQAPQIFVQFPVGAQSGSILVSSKDLPEESKSAEHDFVWNSSEDQLTEASYKSVAGWVGDSILLPTPTVTPEPQVALQPVVAKKVYAMKVGPISANGWWGEPFDANNAYTRLTTELVPQSIQKNQIAVLGKKASEFFKYAQKHGVKNNEFRKMRSGYYTAVASSLWEMKHTKDAAYYLKLALSYESDNTQALALKAKLSQ